MKTRQGGYSLFISLLIFAILGLIALAGITVWNKNASAPATESVSTPTKIEPGTISLNYRTLPKDWSVESPSPEQFVLTNKATGCFIDAHTTRNRTIRAKDSEKIAQQQFQSTLLAIKGKGFVVNDLPPDSILVNTEQTRKEIITKEIDVTGPQNYAQSYGYLIRNGYLVSVQRSCNERSKLPETSVALNQLIIHL